jgi:hypothetical protein
VLRQVCPPQVNLKSITPTSTDAGCSGWLGVSALHMRNFIHTVIEALALAESTPANPNMPTMCGRLGVEQRATLGQQFIDARPCRHFLLMGMHQNSFACGRFSQRRPVVSAAYRYRQRSCEKFKHPFTYVKALWMSMSMISENSTIPRSSADGPTYSHERHLACEWLSGDQT